MGSTGRIKIVFMGTPEFAIPSFEALIASDRFELRLLITQPDRPAGRGRKLTAPPLKPIALANQIDLAQPEKIGERAIVERIASIEPDYILVVAYGALIPRSILSIPKIAPINIHASILPRWRGADPIRRAMLAGDKRLGFSIMVMEEKLDAGPTALIEEIDWSQTDDFGRIHNLIARASADRLLPVLLDLKNRSLAPIEQDHSQATFAPKLTKDEFLIDWNSPAEKIMRQIRALSPTPTARAIGKDGRIIKIFDATIATSELNPSDQIPGRVKIDYLRKEIFVTTGDRLALKITRLARAGKKKVDSAAFLAGRRREADQTGMKFTDL